MSRNEMWRISYHVVPKPNSPAFEKCGGAYVNCWILFAWQDGAELLAKYEVEKEWTITEPAEISWYEPGDIDDDSPHKEYYDQAAIDGGCFVFHQYELESEGSDEDFELENATTKNKKVLKTGH